jgi:SHS2 domain-containing protein
MGYRWIEHTAELELRLDCPTEAAVFEDALAALAELVADGADCGHVRFEVAIQASDRAALFAAWLDELLFKAETEDLIPQGVEQLRLGDGELRATVRAVRGRPRHLVKGVTYHRLSLERSDGGYGATVVRDV